MNACHVVRLSPEERSRLETLVAKGKTQAYRIKHANILLAVDADGPAWTNERTAEGLGCHVGTVSNVRRRFVEHGLDAALERKKQDAPSRRPTGASAGPFNCSPTNSSNSASWSRFPTRPSAARSQKRAAASSARRLGDPARQRRRVCRPHGGYSRRLSAPPRPQTSSGLHGRTARATHQGDAPNAN